MLIVSHLKKISNSENGCLQSINICNNKGWENKTEVEVDSLRTIITGEILKYPYLLRDNKAATNGWGF